MHRRISSIGALWTVQTEELDCVDVHSFHSSNSDIEIKQYGNYFQFVLCEPIDKRLCSSRLLKQKITFSVMYSSGFVVVLSKIHNTYDRVPQRKKQLNMIHF